MFLQQLYRYNKFLFGALLVFITAMLIINYKWGVTATPVQQYGMYSRKMYLADTQKVIRLEADGQPVDFSKYSPVNRDLMQLPVIRFARQQQVNQTAFATMQGIFAKMGLSGLLHAHCFTNDTDTAVFNRWFKAKVENITGRKINSLRVSESYYVWDGKQLHETVSNINPVTIAAD